MQRYEVKKNKESGIGPDGKQIHPYAVYERDKKLEVFETKSEAKEHMKKLYDKINDRDERQSKSYWLGK